MSSAYAVRDEGVAARERPSTQVTAVLARRRGASRHRPSDVVDVDVLVVVVGGRDLGGSLHQRVDHLVGRQPRLVLVRPIIASQ